MNANAKIVIVTRHAGVVEWLRKNGVEGEVITHVADPRQIAGCHVIGTLPFHLAAAAEVVTTIDMPMLKIEQRGKDLTPAEMDEAGASLASYQVRRVE